jgi:hypothetical protein
MGRVYERALKPPQLNQAQEWLRPWCSDLCLVSQRKRITSHLGSMRQVYSVQWVHKCFLLHVLPKHCMILQQGRDRLIKD